MKTFEILDHPADIGIKICGKTLKELFINGALGITFLIVGPDEVSANIQRELDIQASCMEDLFTKWLDEIIFLFDTEGVLVKHVNVEMLNATSLQALVQGERYNKTKHKIKLYLKAVTYHQLEIKEKADNSWEAKVYFDV